MYWKLVFPSKILIKKTLSLHNPPKKKESMFEWKGRRGRRGRSAIPVEEGFTYAWRRLGSTVRNLTSSGSSPALEAAPEEEEEAIRSRSSCKRLDMLAIFQGWSSLSAIIVPPRRHCGRIW